MLIWQTKNPRIHFICLIVPTRYQSCYHKRLTRFHKLAKSLPQDTNRSHNLAKSLPQDTKSFPQVNKSFPQDSKSFPQDSKSFTQDMKSFPQVLLSHALMPVYRQFLCLRYLAYIEVTHLAYHSHIPVGLQRLHVSCYFTCQTFILSILMVT